MSQALEKGLFSLLSGNSPQTTAGSRIYPIMPQGVTFPAIVYERTSTMRKQSLGGAVGVTETVLRLDIGSTSYSAVKTLADEVRTILHDYSGSWSTLNCHNCFLMDEFEEQQQEGDRVTHWVVQLYRVWTDMD